MGKKISIYIENDKLIDAVKKAAKEDKRSMTRYIETILENKMTMIQVKEEAEGMVVK